MFENQINASSKNININKNNNKTMIEYNEDEEDDVIDRSRHARVEKNQKSFKKNNDQEKKFKIKTTGSDFDHSPDHSELEQ
jgi:hypothetical protein